MPISTTIPIVTSFENMPEMSEISPCVSNTSAECDASNTSTSEDDLTTPPQSPTKSTSVPPSEWITKDPKTGLPRYNFPSLSKKKATAPSPILKPSTDFTPPPMSNDWISHDPSSGKIRYNFPSLNKRSKAPPSPAPKFDQVQDVASIPSPPQSPAKKSNNSTSPYTRPGASLALSEIRSGESQKAPTPTPLTSTSTSNSISPPKSDRPQVHMPKSQPLSRMLFSKLSENTPGAPPSIMRKPAKPQKLIVPTKSFQTVFELPLTSSEFARRI